MPEQLFDRAAEYEAMLSPSTRANELWFGSCDVREHRRFAATGPFDWLSEYIVLIAQKRR
jgi:hypothetical protein